MGKNKNNHGHDHHEDEAEELVEQKKDGNKKNPINAVLKIEMHCEGCASKIIKSARSFEGVESVKADAESNKLTVIGKMDPIQIRDFLHFKTNKKVELISPQTKKQDSDSSKNDSNKKSNDNNTKKPDTNSDNKKPKDKEATAITAVIKVAFHCLGCIEKIQKIVLKTKGVQEMTMDRQKETVTVKGRMDVKALTEVLKEKLKRSVEIVPPKKEKEKDGENAGDDGKKKKGDGVDGGAKVEGNRMEYLLQPGYGFGPGYGYIGQPVYGNGCIGTPVPVHGSGYTAVPVYDNGYGYGYGYGYPYVSGYPVHMKFNDENPNACSVM